MLNNSHIGDPNDGARLMSCFQETPYVAIACLPGLKGIVLYHAAARSSLTMQFWS